MKKILFVIDSLHCGGAEKSITTLLNLIDYSKYEVDLQLFGYGGVLEELLPDEVNLLPPLDYTKFTNLEMKKAVVKSITNFKLGMLKSRLTYSYNLRKATQGNAEKARLFWQCTSKSIKPKKNNYDIAVSYAQGIPTFYVAEKINAVEKYCWVNAIYTLEETERIYQKNFYSKYKNIVAVSEAAMRAFVKNYSEYEEKMRIVNDIVDFNTVNRMAYRGDTYEDGFKGIRILTIGRLSYQKGFDIAIDACRRLKSKNINFRWYVLGVGYQKEEIEKWIEDKELQNHFILLGLKPNPYPFIKDCDIYVQTSKFEGFGIAIAEARMLNKPVVTTEFDAVYTQMIQEKNGLVVDINGQAVCDGILRVLNDKKLSESIVKYLKQEKKGNIEELEKFYDLIQGN